MRTIVLSGEPKSTQHIYGLVCRGGIPRRYMTPAGKRLKWEYQLEARAQWKGKPLAGDIEVSISLYFGARRKSDWDNFHKLSCDALSGIAYGDDSQIKRATVTLAYDKARPRIELSLSEL